MAHVALEMAWLLGDAETARKLDLEAISQGLPTQGPVWLMLNRTVPGIEDWLVDNGIVRPELIKPLLMEDTRPRCDQFKDGLLLNLRGVNTNPGAEPEDMLSIRMWVTENRVVALHRLRSLAVEDIEANLRLGEGPESIGHFLTMLAEHLTDRMVPVIQELDEELDALDDLLEDSERVQLEHHQLLAKLAQIRPVATALRRFIAPQQEALSRLSTAQVAWLDDLDRISLRHTVDQVTRIVEDLDELRERATITKDAIQQRMSDALNRSMTWLSAVALVFMPLGVLTGLLGINVGGIPGANHPSAFWIVSAVVVAVGFALWLLMHNRRLL